jgi:hypothetical protein
VTQCRLKPQDSSTDSPTSTVSEQAQSHTTTTTAATAIRDAAAVLATKQLYETVYRIPLMIGFPEPVTIRELTRESRNALSSLLVDYASLIGPTQAKSMILKLSD